MKKLFKVKASYVSYCHIEVLADNSEQAINVARDIDGAEFTPDTNLFDGEWTIEDAIPMTKTITVCGSYGEFTVSATTGKILHRNHSYEYDMIEKFNMPETLENVGDTLADIHENYGLDIILCGYTCYDGTIEPPMPPDEKIAIRERAICGIKKDEMNSQEFSGFSFIKAYSSTSDDDIGMDTFAMHNSDDDDDDVFLQILKDKITVFRSTEFIEAGSIDITDSPLMDGIMEQFQFIDNVMSENTGGGCMVDVLILSDGRYIGITDEVICLYPAIEMPEGQDITWSEDFLLEDIGNIPLV